MTDEKIMIDGCSDRICSEHGKEKDMTGMEQLRIYMEEKGLDGFYVAEPANVRCISGYTGEDSWLLIGRKNQYFITDPRYTEQASMECPECQETAGSERNCEHEYHTDTDEKYLYFTHHIYHGCAAVYHGCIFHS